MTLQHIKLFDANCDIVGVIMHFLPLKPAANLDGIFISAHHQSLSLNSPATSAMTDYLDHRPPVLRSDTSAVLAEQLMIQEQDKLRAVVGSDGCVLGIVTRNDVCKQQVMQWVANGLDREEVLVKHLMQPKASLVALQYADLEGSTVADVAYTMKKDGAQFCLVLDDADGHLRGIISANELTERLGFSVKVSTAPTFSTLVHALHL